MFEKFETIPAEFEGLQITEFNVRDVAKEMMLPDHRLFYNNEVDFIKKQNAQGVYVQTDRGIKVARIDDYILRNGDSYIIYDSKVFEKQFKKV